MAKLYNTGNGLKSCPQCGKAKDPFSTKCKNCGLDLGDLNLFRFGVDGGSEKTQALLKEFEKNAGSVDRNVCAKRDEALKSAILYMNRTDDRAYDHLCDAIRGGSTKAAVTLAELYARGKFNDKPSECILDILALLCSAASRGSEDAARKLYADGYRMKLDRASCWREKDGAVEMLQKASDLGMTWAKYCIGRYFFFGQCGLQKDIGKAKQIIRSAADDDYNPNERAKRHVALCAFDGVGGYAKDVDYALVYARSSGALKNGTICEILNRTDLCKGDKFVLKAKDDFDISDQLDFIQLGRLIQDATERYKTISNADWVNSSRSLGHDVDLRKSKYPQTEWCAYLMNRTQAKKWSAVQSKTRLGFPADEYYKGRGVVVATSKVYSNDYFRPGGIDFSISDFFSTRIPNLFSKFPKEADFGGLDYSREDLVDYLKYLRRYILWDRKGGVELIDGSRQKEVVAKEAEVPTKTSVKHEVFRGDNQKTLSTQPNTVSSNSSVSSKKSARKDPSAKHVRPVKTSAKKRWAFVLIGLIFGIFGLHFLYARRKGWFFLYWLMIIANVAQTKVPAMADVSGKTPYFGLIAGLMLVGSIFFMKKDGDGNRM